MTSYSEKKWTAESMGCMSRTAYDSEAAAPRAWCVKLAYRVASNVQMRSQVTGTVNLENDLPEEPIRYSPTGTSLLNDSPSSSRSVDAEHVASKRSRMSENERSNRTTIAPQNHKDRWKIFWKHEINHSSTLIGFRRESQFSASRKPSLVPMHRNCMALGRWTYSASTVKNSSFYAS